MSQGKIPPNVLSTAESFIQHLIIYTYSRLYSTFHTAQHIFRKQCLWKQDCSWHCVKSDMLHI
jgi:hypothetical protein